MNVKIFMKDSSEQLPKQLLTAVIIHNTGKSQI